MFPEPIIFLGMPIHLFGIFAALSILLGYLVTASEMRRPDAVRGERRTGRRPGGEVSGNPGKGTVPREGTGCVDRTPSTGRR